MAVRDRSSKTEILRWWAALSGLLLWFIYIWVLWEVTGADALRYCAAKTASGETCVYDNIPMEMLVIPIFVFGGAYFFARFAFGIYAPARRLRQLRWSFAGGIDVVATYPVLQVLAALGMVWSALRLAALPFAFIHWGVIVYWLLWILWFGGAIFASLPRRFPPEGDEVIG
jgi:hypothetical protein